MPIKIVEEPKNPNLKISGTPLIITVAGVVEDSVDAEITMPYVTLEGFEEDSVGMYVKFKGEWEYVGGEINKYNNTVTTTISNVSDYLDQDNEVMLALMEVLCVSCYGSSLTRVFQPEGGSEHAVILMHGFAPKPNTFQALIDDIKLTNQPLEVWTFDYSSSKPVNETVNELLVLFEKNLLRYENIHIVAHSLGGLVIQDALYDSYMANRVALENGEPQVYGYVDKMRKIILIATPNEGSPLLDVYRNFFGSFINDGQQALFNPNAPVMDDLVNGLITPRVSGIDYYVIAGTKPYGFNLLFFEMSTEELVDHEKNDGIITVKSAQRVGDGYINNQCENYWELNLSHTELIKHPIARKVIGKIITEDMSTTNSALFGHNKYFDISVDDCSADDNFIIIGKEVKEEWVFDEAGCSCGNDYCGEGEDELSCTSDCAQPFLSEGSGRPYFLIIVGLITFILCFQYMTFSSRQKPNIKKLVEHIKTNYNIQPGEGYTTEQLRDAFIQRGWPKLVVNNSFKLLDKEFDNTYHKPLRKHVIRHLKKGYSEEEIKRFLIQYGWPKDILDRFFRGELLKPGYVYKYKYRFLEGARSYFGIAK
jgi:hypothetical protein